MALASCRAQPGGTFLACSAALSGAMLAAVQTSGGYASPFGLPASASYLSSKLVCGAAPVLPYGTGGNPIALTYNGQVIDVVRAPAARGVHAAWAPRYLLVARRMCSRPPAAPPVRAHDAPTQIGQAGPVTTGFSVTENPAASVTTTQAHSMTRANTVVAGNVNWAYSAAKEWGNVVTCAGSGPTCYSFLGCVHARA